MEKPSLHGSDGTPIYFSGASMTSNVVFAGLFCALAAFGCDAAGLPVSSFRIPQSQAQQPVCDGSAPGILRGIQSERAEMAMEAAELKRSAGGSGTAGHITVQRGNNGYGFIVRAGGSTEHVTSAEAAAIAVERYKKDGYGYDGNIK